MIYTEDYPQGERPKFLDHLRAGHYIRDYTPFDHNGKNGFDVMLRKDGDYYFALGKPEWADQEQAEEPREVEAREAKPAQIQG